MDYTSIFTLMRAEVTLTAILVFVFLYDLMAGERERRRFSAVVCCLMVVQVVVNLVPAAGGELFGGMFCHTPMDGIVKSMLSVGALIVFLQSDTWLRREDTRHKQGEFYILTLSTLLGMYFMIGAGNFLLFFIGLELASVPMACLVAFDKYKRYSAEAGAKYILCALFSSGLMLYGISFLYGTTGTLYFGDMAARIDGSPLQVMALVFFLSGLGFKISLVPFHLWTADAYQGAPTNVTAYLSVVSKGAAAFVLLTVLVKVFAPMTEQWQTLLWIVTVSSITVANLFAIRQKDLKRFMAFSSISQAGYIMLAVIGGSAIGMTSLVFYVLVYMAANLAVFGVLSAVQRRQGLAGGLQRVFPHQSPPGAADDPGVVLAGRNPALRRVLLEILRLRRGFQWRIPPAGLHRAGQHGRVALLLPVDRQGDVHYARRRADRGVPQRPLHARQPRALHGRRPAAGHRQRGLRRHQRLCVRALTRRDMQMRGAGDRAPHFFVRVRLEFAGLPPGCVIAAFPGRAAAP